MLSHRKTTSIVFKLGLSCLSPRPDIDVSGKTYNHSVIEQDLIEKAFKKKEYCPTVFLDVSQAFERVWHQGVM